MFLLYALIIGCFGYIGFALSKQYDRKRQIYSDLLSLCVALNINLNYMKLPIKTVYTNQAQKTRKDLSAYLAAQAEDKHGALPFISAEQTQEVQDFFSQLGANDTQSQKQHIGFYENIFNQHLQSASVQCKEKGTLYKKLFVLLGVLVCIILL